MTSHRNILQRSKLPIHDAPKAAISISFSILLLTAGCSGLGGSSTEATPNQQSGQATPIPPATAVPVATEEPGSELNEPTTSAADDGANPYVGAVSEDAILSNHRETLSEAGSYSFTQNISIDNQQGGTELDEVWSVGTDTGETLVETEMRAGTTTSYTTEDGTTYSREQRDGETYYGVTATPENNVGLGGLSELNYTHRTEQVDGKTLHIYR